MQWYKDTIRTTHFDLQKLGTLLIMFIYGHRDGFPKYYYST